MTRRHHRNPFDKTDRGLSHYQRLKNDVSEKSDNLLISLPLFVRIVFTDQASPWFSEFNRYDLLNPFFVHPDFPIRKQFSSNIECCTTILTVPKTGQKSITSQEFLAAPIVKLNSDLYTVQDFVSSIAYNRGLHNKPDKPELEYLYTNFIEKHSVTSFQMVVDIAACFVKSFEQVYQKFMGNNDAFSDDYGHQPQFLLDGNRPVCLFLNSYMQLPIRSRKHCGIRICLTLKLETKDDDTSGHIFSYGHRQQPNIVLTCRQERDQFLIQAKQKSPKASNLIRIPITDDMTKEFFKLEVSLYSDGNFVVAVDELLKKIGKTGRSFNIYDGKLIIGADLNGKNFGNFSNSLVVVEAIDTKNRTERVFASAMHKIKPFTTALLPAVALHRPIQS